VQAIKTQNARRAEPSSSLVLAAAGALLAILCLLVLVAAALNGTSQAAAPAVKTVATQPAADAGTDSENSGSQDSQPTFGFLP